MPYSSFLTPRKDVLSPDGVEGIIDLANIGRQDTGVIESNPELFFDLTYPTDDIRGVLEDVNRRFSDKFKTSGLFLFEALKGAGKSHLLLLIHNLFKYPAVAGAWLTRHKIACHLPKDEFVVILNKFTDNPHNMVWNLVLEGLGEKPITGDPEKTLKKVEKAINCRKLILIFDEMEQGIRCISDPAIQSQNISFLQMLSEYANRSKDVTLFASIYSDTQEPGSTLKRVPRRTVTLGKPKDRSRIILHRLFENYSDDISAKISPVIDSYAQLWKKHTAIDVEKTRADLLECYPFSPNLLKEIVHKRIPAKGGFQNVRGALYFLGNLVRLTHGNVDIITPAAASIEDDNNVGILKDLDIGGALLERAKENATDLRDKTKLSAPLSSAVILYTLASAGSAKGATREELLQDLLTPTCDVNDIERALQLFPKFASYFHHVGAHYYFDLPENSEAKVEFKSGNYSDGQAQELLHDAWQNDIFRDSSSCVVYRGIDETQTALKNLPKNRLRYILAGRALTQEERHKLYHGIENRNLLLLIEPKDEQFNLYTDRDLCKWAQRVLAAKDLTSQTNDSSKQSEYQRISKADRNSILERIRRTGFVFIHWEYYGETVSDDSIEREPLAGDGSKDKILERLNQEYFPYLTIKEHLERRLNAIKNRPVKDIEQEYKISLGYPIPVSVSAVQKALMELCKDRAVGIQHTSGNWCGERPQLSETELSQAQIVPPWDTQPSPSPMNCPVCGKNPCVCAQPPATGPTDPDVGSQEKCPTCGANPCNCKRKAIQQKKLLPKPGNGQLRQELAAVLQSYETARIKRIQYKIFLQKNGVGDLSTLPAGIRGSLSGNGDITAEITVTKSGDFSKAQAEQQAEALPAIPDALYSADITFETETDHD